MERSDIKNKHTDRLETIVVIGGFIAVMSLIFIGMLISHAEGLRYSIPKEVRYSEDKGEYDSVYTQIAFEYAAVFVLVLNVIGSIAGTIHIAKAKSEQADKTEKEITELIKKSNEKQ